MENHQKQEANYSAMVGEWMQAAQTTMNHFMSDALGRQQHGADDDKTTDITKWYAAALKQWSGWYEKETCQMLNIPPIGIARNYQRDLNQTFETFNQLQVMLVEFLLLMYQPVEQSFNVLQTDLRQAQSPEDMEALQGKWVKNLETQYLSMFRSTKYLETFSKTITALNAYTGARSKALEDLFSTLPIPKNSDMDELYKEIYILKKRLRMLEKTMPSQMGAE